MTSVSGAWRRLLFAFSDTAPVFQTMGWTSEGGWVRRLISAFSDASPAFRPSSPPSAPPAGDDRARTQHRSEPPGHHTDVVADTSFQPRQPVVLCLDTSMSMTGAPIHALNVALREWAEELRSDPFLTSAVEVAVVTFGESGATAWQGPRPLPPQASASPFVRADLFEPPHLTAAGTTPMTEALNLTVCLVAARKAELRDAKVPYHRPTVLLVTDGTPTDGTGHLTETWRALVPLLAGEQRARRLRFYAIGVGDVNDAGYGVLKALAPDFSVRLPGFPFRELFQMISVSASAMQHDSEDDVHAEIFAQFKRARETR